MSALPRRDFLGLVGAAILTGGAGAGVALTRPSVKGGVKAKAVQAASSSPETDPAKLSIPLSKIPGYTAPAVVGPGSFKRPMTAPMGTMTWLDYNGGDADWQVYDQASKPLPDATPASPVAWPQPEAYSPVKGVLTFRGNNHRTAPAYGTADVTRRKLEIVWTQHDGVLHSYGSVFPGSGWTGQPLLVNWPQATKQAMGLDARYVNDPDFVEVIYPVFDGHIYRFDLKTGTPTKDPIVTQGGFKGTGSIDPRGYPLMVAGQGLNDVDGSLVPWGHKMFNLITGEEIFGLNGQDPVSHRPHWGAWDSSALFCGAADTFVQPGENGVLYRVKLNSSFDAASKTLKVNPAVVKMVYATPSSQQYGIESSQAAYRNLMYASDNDGNLLCWDVNTMQLLWVQNVNDNDDSTVSIDETADGVYLYNANSVGWRGSNRTDMVTNVRKLDALTGQVLWETKIPVYYNQYVKGGCESSPMIGHGETSGLVFFTVAKTTAQAEGELIAFNKADGSIAWQRHLTHYSWSSPTLITATDGHQYLVFGDSGGNVNLVSATTGAFCDAVNLGGNVEASCSAYNDMIVVGSYSQKICGIRIS